MMYGVDPFRATAIVMSLSQDQIVTILRIDDPNYPMLAEEQEKMDRIKEKGHRAKVILYHLCGDGIAQWISNVVTWHVRTDRTYDFERFWREPDKDQHLTLMPAACYERLVVLARQLQLMVAMKTERSNSFAQRCDDRRKNRRSV